jgi:hypothetical protein
MSSKDLSIHASNTRLSVNLNHISVENVGVGVLRGDGTRRTLKSVDRRFHERVLMQVIFSHAHLYLQYVCRTMDCRAFHVLVTWLDSRAQ